MSSKLMLSGRKLDCDCDNCCCCWTCIWACDTWPWDMGGWGWAICACVICTCNDLRNTVLNDRTPFWTFCLLPTWSKTLHTHWIKSTNLKTFSRKNNDHQTRPRECTCSIPKYLLLVEWCKRVRVFWDNFAIRTWQFRNALMESTEVFYPVQY